MNEYPSLQVEWILPSSTIRLCGKVSNHHKYPDNHSIKTSSVQQFSVVNGVVLAKTYNTTYIVSFPENSNILEDIKKGFPNLFTEELGK